MIEELSKPDPFYVRLEIANEHERMATHLMERASAFTGDVRTALMQMAWAHEHRAEVMRGQLQRLADKESRELEDARSI